MPEALLDLFKSFQLSIDDKKQYRKMLNSFIYDASQYRPSKKDRENARTNKLINNQEYYSNYIDREGFWKELVR